MLPFDIPVQVGRDDARAAATRELLKPIYHRDDPTLYDRAREWFARLIGRLLDRTVSVLPGGAWGLLVIVLVIVAIVLLALWRRGAPARAGARWQPGLLTDDGRTAREMRAAAEAAAAAGDWTLALQERFRAVVRGLEERTVIEPRPGWTAAEAAAGAGRALPDLAEQLRAGASRFDGVTYGGRRADAAAYQQIAALDAAVVESRPRRDKPASTPTMAAPR